MKFGLSYARVKRERRLEEVGAFPSKQAAYSETGSRNPGRNDWRYLALKNSNGEERSMLAIDADSHFMEPLDLFERYIDPKFRDRAYKVEKDPTTGKRRLVVDNKPL